MNIKVKLFGSLVDKTGKSELPVNGCTDTDSLKKIILNEYPQLKECVFLISVNKSLVKGNYKLESENEVALLPPFAGG